MGTLKELLNQAKAEKMQVWQQAREDKELLTRQVEELQNVMQTLKKEKEEHYRESRRDKEVMERILSDLENSFTRMQEEREDSLGQAKSSTEMLSTELARLHDQLEQSRGVNDDANAQGTSDREMLSRMIKDMEEQCATAIREKAHFESLLAQASGNRSDMELAREEYKSMLSEVTADKDAAISMLRDEKTYLTQQLKTLSDDGAASGEVLKATQEEI